MLLKTCRQSLLVPFFSASIILITPAIGNADKLDFTAGAYQFAASNKRNNTSSTLSGLGSYHLGYRRALLNNYELDLGYSLLATEIFAGDLSFGFDVGINYFPITSAGDIQVSAGDDIAIFQHLWRPFLGLGFHQRNFQSTNSQYAGVGFKIGCEYQAAPQFSYLGIIRYISLGGPNNSDANQLDFSIGASFQF